MIDKKNIAAPSAGFMPSLAPIVATVGAAVAIGEVWSAFAVLANVCEFDAGGEVAESGASLHNDISVGGEEIGGVSDVGCDVGIVARGRAGSLNCFGGCGRVKRKSISWSGIRKSFSRGVGKLSRRFKRSLSSRRGRSRVGCGSDVRAPPPSVMISTRVPNLETSRDGKSASGDTMSGESSPVVLRREGADKQSDGVHVDENSMFLKCHKSNVHQGASGTPGTPHRGRNLSAESAGHSAEKGSVSSEGETNASASPTLAERKQKLQKTISSVAPDKERVNEMKPITSSRHCSTSLAGNKVGVSSFSIANDRQSPKPNSSQSESDTTESPVAPLRRRKSSTLTTSTETRPSAISSAGLDLVPSVKERIPPASLPNNLRRSGSTASGRQSPKPNSSQSGWDTTESPVAPQRKSWKSKAAMNQSMHPQQITSASTLSRSFSRTSNDNKPSTSSSGAASRSMSTSEQETVSPFPSPASELSASPQLRASHTPLADRPMSSSGATQLAHSKMATCASTSDAAARSGASTSSLRSTEGSFTGTRLTSRESLSRRSVGASQPDKGKKRSNSFQKSFTKVTSRESFRKLASRLDRPVEHTMVMKPNFQIKFTTKFGTSGVEIRK